MDSYSASVSSTDSLHPSSLHSHTNSRVASPSKARTRPLTSLMRSLTSRKSASFFATLSPVGTGLSMRRGRREWKGSAWVARFGHPPADFDLLDDVVAVVFRDRTLCLEDLVTGNDREVVRPLSDRLVLVEGQLDRPRAAGVAALAQEWGQALRPELAKALLEPFVRAAEDRLVLRHAGAVGVVAHVRVCRHRWEPGVVLLAAPFFPSAGAKKRVRLGSARLLRPAPRGRPELEAIAGPRTAGVTLERRPEPALVERRPHGPRDHPDEELFVRPRGRQEPHPP